MKATEKLARLPRLEAREIGRPRFRHHNPLMPGKLYSYDQPLYDMYIIAPATATDAETLFSQPIGANVTPPGGNAIRKNAFHTNLAQAGVLKAPDKFIGRALQLSVAAQITPNDMRRFLFQTLVQFLIDGVAYFQGVAQEIPGAGGPHSGAAQGLVVNGWPDHKNMRVLDLSGETIEQSQNFAMNVDTTQYQDGIATNGAFTTDATTTTPAGAGIIAKFYVQGTYSRAVK